jgi:hypothetical protein
MTFLSTQDVNVMNLKYGHQNLTIWKVHYQKSLFVYD